MGETSLRFLLMCPDVSRCSRAVASSATGSDVPSCFQLGDAVISIGEGGGVQVGLHQSR